MTETTRRVLFSCFIILVVACLCLSVVALVGTLGLVFTRNQPPAISLPSLPTKQITPVEPFLAVELSETEIQAKMDEIQIQVTALRNLEAQGQFKRALLTPEELRERVVNDFLKEYTPEEAVNDTRALAAFGLLEENFDLLNFLLDLYSEQIAGFYDQETKEMYVVKGESFLGPERMTYAHEYTHALQDQNYDIEKGLNYSEEACEQDTERCAAIQSLLEGDASLTELKWFETSATSQERKEIFEFYQVLESPIYESAPEYMKADFLFPYEKGLAFVQFLFDAGGWEEVNQAYQSLPASTEQILHPEKYPDDLPVSVSLPDLNQTLGDGWEEISEGAFGEWYTLLLLSKGVNENYRLPERQAEKAAEGWGGDAYAVYFNEEEKATTLILTITWDAETDAREFFQAFQIYGNARFGEATTRDTHAISWRDDQTAAVIYRSGNQTTWIMAPDEAILDQLREVLESQ